MVCIFHICKPIPRLMPDEKHKSKEVCFAFPKTYVYFKYRSGESHYKQKSVKVNKSRWKLEHLCSASKLGYYINHESFDILALRDSVLHAWAQKCTLWSRKYINLGVRIAALNVSLKKLTFVFLVFLLKKICAFANFAWKDVKVFLWFFCLF